MIALFVIACFAVISVFALLLFIGLIRLNTARQRMDEIQNGEYEVYRLPINLTTRKLR
jgi:hypothetical protein